MSDENEEPKLIIDDDWKEQVQREKEALSDKEKSTSGGGSDDAESTSQELPPPPASFEMLTSMLASQALMSMGQIPNPTSGKPEKNKAFAKHYIDTLSMLEDKTQGNLSPEESSMLAQTLHQLRMLFISV